MRAMLALALLCLAHLACAAAAVAAADPPLPLINQTDCLLRSYFLERALQVNPGLTPLQVGAMVDALSGDPVMGKGCVITAPAAASALPRARAPPPPPSAPGAAEVFADALHGSDATGSGTLAAPFQSVARALQALRAAGGGGGGGGLGTITLRGGATFHLPATLALGPSDSGLTLQTYALDAERAWLSGAAPLAGLAWRAVNTSGGANVWAADLTGALPPGVTEVASLRLGGARLTRARYPNANPETGQPFATRGGATAAAAWLPIAHPVPAVTWTAPNVSRPDSACSSYSVAINGTSCGRYTPPVSHYCGGSGVVAGSAVFTAAQLPHQPYANPLGAVLTAMHAGAWCTFQYRVGAYSFAGGNGTFELAEGGQQCGRPEAAHGAVTIEGVLEELDEPGEFYFDAVTKVLTLWHNASSGTPPPSDGSLAVPFLQQLLAARGSAGAPVAALALRRLGFRDTAPAAFAPHTAPSGSDYAVNRRAALTLEGVAGVDVQDCSFLRLDNSGVFVGGFARGVSVADSEFAWLGENGIVTLGDTAGAPVEGWGPDGSAGTQPRGTQVLRNFAHELGVVNKQSCFFFQAVSDNATLDGNVVFNGARHGVQYNDAFGTGSVMRNMVMFNLNRETADTGPYNNWDRLAFVQRKDEAHVDWHHNNLNLVNYNSVSAYDTDDCSAYHLMENSVQLYGSGLKSDFSGHDITYANTLSVWGHSSDQYQALVPGYFNAMRGQTQLAAAEGESIFSHVCPNASDWPRLTDSAYFSPLGNVTLCQRSVQDWQAAVPGVLRNVTTAPFPPGLTAEAIVDLARATLATPAQGV